MKTYEIIDPLGICVKVEAEAVVVHENGQIVLYSKPDIIFKNIVAVAPATHFVYQVIKSRIQ